MKFVMVNDLGLSDAELDAPLPIQIHPLARYRPRGVDAFMVASYKGEPVAVIGDLEPCTVQSPDGSFTATAHLLF